MAETPSTTENLDIGPAPDDLDMASILRRTLIGIGLMISVVLGGLLLFKAQIETFSKGFVDIFGAFGVALGYFIPDAFTLPIPNDAVAFFGLNGGIPFWTVVFWGSIGSITGGIVGFYIGRLLQRTRIYRALMAKRGRELEALMARYGVWALAIAALTPIPYSIACWACGAGDMSFKTFVLVSLLRIPKVALYLYLLQLGLLSIG